MIDILIPVKVTSPQNGSHGHWSTQAKDRKAQRTITRWALMPLSKPALPVVVTLTRIGVRDLDDDNLAAGFKSVRDEIAAWLGCGDGKRDPITWHYAQTRGEPKQYAARIHIESETQ
jgi:hypothetical protein